MQFGDHGVTCTKMQFPAIGTNKVQSLVERNYLYCHVAFSYSVVMFLVTICHCMWKLSYYCLYTSAFQSYNS